MGLSFMFKALKQVGQWTRVRRAKTDSDITTREQGLPYPDSVVASATLSSDQ